MINPTGLRQPRPISISREQEESYTEFITKAVTITFSYIKTYFASLLGPFRGVCYPIEFVVELFISAATWTLRKIAAIVQPFFRTADVRANQPNIRAVIVAPQRSQTERETEITRNAPRQPTRESRPSSFQPLRSQETDINKLLHSLFSSSDQYPEKTARILNLLDFVENISLLERNGRNALNMAAQYGNIEIIQKLSDIGLQVNELSDKGAEALIRAVEANKPIILQKLFDHGFKINELPDKGAQALYVAARSGQANSVEKLFDVGVRITSFSKTVLDNLLQVRKPPGDEFHLKHLIDKKYIDRDRSTPKFCYFPVKPEIVQLFINAIKKEKEPLMKELESVPLPTVVLNIIAEYTLETILPEEAIKRNKAYETIWRDFF